MAYAFLLHLVLHTMLAEHGTTQTEHGAPLAEIGKLSSIEDLLLDEDSKEVHRRELGHLCACHSGAWIRCSFFGSSQCCKCVGACTCAGYIGFCALEAKATCDHLSLPPPPPPPPWSLDSSSEALSSAAAEQVMGSWPLYWGGGNHPKYTVTVGTKLTFHTVVMVNTLWMMPDRTAWDNCDFTNAIELAGPYHGGGTMPGFNRYQAVVTMPTVLYFACIRSDPMPGDGLHCRTLGQKAIVYVVSPSPSPPPPSPPPPSAAITTAAITIAAATLAPAALAAAALASAAITTAAITFAAAALHPAAIAAAAITTAAIIIAGAALPSAAIAAAAVALAAAAITTAAITTAAITIAAATLAPAAVAVAPTAVAVAAAITTLAAAITALAAAIITAPILAIGSTSSSTSPFATSSSFISSILAP